jgi:two-component system cell cycle sensor histidine kinase/response regulator CckA
VVDDFQGMRDSIRDCLNEFGHEVQVASGGEEALQLLNESEPIDLLISDIEMPRMGGIELWSRVQMRMPRASVLFLSGHGAELFGNNQLLPGEVLSKPVDVQKLEEKLKVIQARIEQS